MTPAAIIAIIGLVEEVIREEPAIAADIQKLFAGGNPTPEDFAAFRASVAAETYGQFVPDSDLPKD